MTEEQVPQAIARLEELLEETNEIAQQNHKILKRMERNALFAFFAKVIIWLIVLGVPLFFFGPYLKPIYSLMTEGRNATTTPTSGIFGLPSAQELQNIVNSYRAK